MKKFLYDFGLISNKNFNFNFYLQLSIVMQTILKFDYTLVEPHKK